MNEGGKEPHWGRVEVQGYDEKSNKNVHKEVHQAEDFQPVRGKRFHMDLRNRSPPKYDYAESAKKLSKIKWSHPDQGSKPRKTSNSRSKSKRSPSKITAGS